MFGKGHKRTEDRMRINPIRATIYGNTQSTEGMVMDIHHHGAKLWLDNPISDENFLIIIPVSDAVNPLPLCVQTEKVWSESSPNQLVTSVGCHFESLTSKQKKVLDHLLDYLEKEKKIE